MNYRPHTFFGAPGGRCSVVIKRRVCGRPRWDRAHLRYPCDLCGFVAWSVDGRLRHLDRGHPRLFCPVCALPMGTVAERDSHVPHAHPLLRKAFGL